MKRKLNISNLPLLWKMVLLALIVHMVFLVGLSPRYFGGADNTPEKIYEEGQQAMERGDYLQAMEHYRRVLDMQPKPPPVFEKAAQQHAQADRLLKQRASQPLTTAPASPTPAGTTTTPPPVTPPTPAPATKKTPDEPFVPPELRPK